MTDVLLPTDPLKLKRFHQNHKAYANNPHLYKMYYIFKKYPYIQIEHSVDIVNYFKINGPNVDNSFIIFLRKFIRPFLPRVYKPKPNGLNKLPKMLRNIITKSTDEDEDSNSSEDC